MKIRKQAFTRAALPAANKPQRPAFTLVELLVVIGIIALLISILLPALNKARAASKAAVCLSNVRQMGNAWAIYLAENRGRLPHYIWRPGGANGPEIAWRGYWIGILATNKLQPGSVLCPEASDPVWANLGGRGFGTAKNAWSGEFQVDGTGIRIDSKKLVNNTLDASKGGYRIGSYGFNRRITIESNTFGASIARVKRTSDVPVFYDSVWVDNLSMPNGTPTSPPQMPRNLSGVEASTVGSGSDHFRILINRHNRAINVCFADGSARPVRLDDVYTLQWTPTWVRYRLPRVPAK